VHEATGHTPAFLNHGRELRRPEERASPAEDETPHAVQRRLREAYDIVRIKLARAFQRQEQYYNLRRRDWRPRVGEWVWKRDHPLSRRADAFNAKLAPKYIGPFEVRRIVSPVIVDLRSKSGKWYRHVHVQELKPAPSPQAENNGSANENNPAEEENNDPGEGRPPEFERNDTGLAELTLPRAMARNAEPDDILDIIRDFLGEPIAEYDPERPGLEEAGPSRPPAGADPPGIPGPPKLPAVTTPARPAAVAGYRRGQLRQPSDRRTKSKMAWLTAVPPPVPRLLAPRQPELPKPTLDPIRLMGPLPPPPVPVEVEPGIIVDVPYFAVHSSREYKARQGARRWHLRFDRAGRLRSCREKSYGTPRTPGD
jgi:hypothetical protein